MLALWLTTALGPERRKTGGLLHCSLVNVGRNGFEIDAGIGQQRLPRVIFGPQRGPERCPLYPDEQTSPSADIRSVWCQQASARHNRGGLATVQRRSHQRRLFASRRASFSSARSCFLLHCNRHTAHGGRNFSTDPDATEL
jgi:hypothetical protein